MVTENSSGQNLGRFRHAPRGLFEFTILNFETLLQNFLSMSIISPNSKQSVQWLLRTRPGKIWAERRRRNGAKKNVSPLRLGDLIMCNISLIGIYSLHSNFYLKLLFCQTKTSGPSCSKRRYLYELVKGHFVNSFSRFNILIFFAEKYVSSFCTAKATHIFSAKNFSIFAYHLM